MGAFKKYDDIVQEREDLLFEQLIEETFEGIDEGFLSNIKKLGLWKGLKLSLGKNVKKLMDYIKDNKKLKEDITKFAQSVGGDAVEDFGNIMGETAKKYQEEIDELEKKLKIAEDKAK